MAVFGGLGGHSNHDDVGDLLDGLDDLDPPDLRPVVDDSLEHILENFDAYHEMRLMNEEDWDDLDAVRLVFEQNRRKRKAKHRHDRKQWDSHEDMLLQTDAFDQRFRMPEEHFYPLLDAIRDAITVDFKRSRNSTGGNDPIYPEVVIVMGLRFTGLGSTIFDLADLYGMSESSVQRCVNMFLDAIDFNTDLAELQIKLPDPTDLNALKKDGGGRIGIIEGEEFDPVEHVIEPMTGTGNQNSNNGFLETHPLDDTTVQQFSSLLPDASRRESIVEEIISRSLRRPDHNMERNLD